MIVIYRIRMPTAAMAQQARAVDAASGERDRAFFESRFRLDSRRDLLGRRG